MDYHLALFRRWQSENLTLSNAYSGASLRLLVTHVLKGGNYRDITEQNTKDKLFLTYLWLIKIYEEAKTEFGDNWKQSLVAHLAAIKRKSPEQKNLYTWLIGLPHKTAKNLVVGGEIGAVLQATHDNVAQLLGRVGRINQIDISWLLLMAGAATLTIRGSDKSTVGKKLEQVIIKTALTILGFTFDRDFWINIGRDAQVGRETDAEVEGRRGRIRIEVGLIASGNQEVIEDKIGRMNANDVILYDIIGSRSNIRPTAANRQVNLIQIRDNNCLVELHRVLQPLVRLTLTTPPATALEIDTAVTALPDGIFEV